MRLGQCRRPARRFGTFRRPRGLDEAIVANLCDPPGHCSPPLPPPTDVAGLVVTYCNQTRCAHVGALTKLSKSLRRGL